jgi:anaerobic selenocysteine-containing dehydrogenase
LVSSIDAGRLGLRDGARARIANGPRSIEVEVEITDDMMPGVVSLPHGWGHDQPGSRMGGAGARPGANINALLDESLRDPLSGNAVLGGVPITMQPL